MYRTEPITSRANPRLVHARRVRDGRVAGQIFIEGRRLVEEALLSGMVINECFVSDGFSDDKLIFSLAKRTTGVTTVSDKIFNSVADTAHTQGIVVTAERPVSMRASMDVSPNSSGVPIVLYLHEVNNPSNLGAIIRTVEAAGAVGIIVSTHSADVYSPKALRAAMGASFRLPVWEDAKFDEAISWARKKDLTPTATVASAAKSYVDANLRIPRLLIFGSEARGLRSEQLNGVDEIIRIPMEIGVESLNLAVAAGVILFEAKRQIETK